VHTDLGSGLETCNSQFLEWLEKTIGKSVQAKRKLINSFIKNAEQKREHFVMEVLK